MQTMSPFRRYFSAAGTLDLGTYQIPRLESWFSIRAISGIRDGFDRSCLLLCHAADISFMSRLSFQRPVTPVESVSYSGDRTYREPAFERGIWYVPKSKVPAAEKYLRNGDIVCIVTTWPQGYTSHVGLAYRDGNGVLRFMHATKNAGKVIIDSRLSSYLNRYRTNAGVASRDPMIRKSRGRRAETCEIPLQRNAFSPDCWCLFRRTLAT